MRSIATAVVTLLLVLALGSGAVAQEPSPEPTPLYAPEDVGLLFPRSLNGLPLTVVSRTGDDVIADAPEYAAEYLQGRLSSLGKDPSDFLLASALTGDDPLRPIEWIVDPEAYFITVERVRGIPAVVWGNMNGVSLDLDDDDPLPDGFDVSAPTEDGRTFLSVEPATSPDESWFVRYAKGEVLFTVQGRGGLSIEEVLAELP